MNQPFRDNSITRGDAEYVSREDYVLTDIHSLEIPNTTTWQLVRGSVLYKTIMLTSKLVLAIKLLA